MATIPLRRWLPWLLLLSVLPACDDLSFALDAGPDGGAVDARPAPREDAGPPPEDLDGFIEHHMAAGGLPGAAVAIARPGEVAFVGAYGFADLEAERPVDAHTLFIMASVSKTVAAVRAMQLVEQGLLDLDAPLETYLGHDARHPVHPDAPLTARMLLAHTSGIEDSFATLAEVTTNDADPSVTLGDFTEGYLLEGGAFYGPENWGARPGARHRYANAGFGVLGAVLEAAGGADLRAQTEAELFAPLAMDGAGWFLADVERERLATPYGYNGRSYNALPQNGFAFYPASSLRVSITGLARFAAALLAGGALDGERILEAASVEEMLRIQAPDLDATQALAFSERGVAGHRYIGHSGSTFGGSTQLLLSREGTHAIVLITNSDAYIRSRFGFPEGAQAMEAILARLDAEARAAP